MWDWLKSVLRVPGVQPVVKHLLPLSGEDMTPEDRATEQKIQTRLDQLKMAHPGWDADQLENQLRVEMPQDFSNWRLRESDSTSSGFRPTQMISKKRAAAYTAMGIGGGVGGAALAGGFAPSAGISGGLSTSGATTGALAGSGETLFEGAALPAAGLGGDLGGEALAMTPYVAPTFESPTSTTPTVGNSPLSTPTSSSGISGSGETPFEGGHTPPGLGPDLSGQSPALSGGGKMDYLNKFLKSPAGGLAAGTGLDLLQSYLNKNDDQERVPYEGDVASQELMSKLLGKLNDLYPQLQQRAANPTKLQTPTFDVPQTNYAGTRYGVTTPDPYSSKRRDKGYSNG